MPTYSPRFAVNFMVVGSVVFEMMENPPLFTLQISLCFLLSTLNALNFIKISLNRKIRSDVWRQNNIWNLHWNYRRFRQEIFTQRRKILEISLVPDRPSLSYQFFHQQDLIRIPSPNLLILFEPGVKIALLFQTLLSLQIATLLLNVVLWVFK